MESEENKSSELPKIRTFKTDASSYIQQNKVSDFEMAAKTYISQKKTGGKLSQINYKKAIFIASGVAALALAGFFGYAYLSGRFEKPAPVKRGPSTPPKFVQTETETDITFIKTDKGSLADSIKNELGKQLKFGTANTLWIKSGADFITAQAFIAAMNWEVPADFAEALEPNFNALAVYQGSGTAPVFIFKTKNFVKAFAALLEWEPSMWQDLKPFIDLNGVDVKTFYRKPFIDDTIKNNDARAFTTVDGRTLFEYALFSQKFIIISSSRDALGLVLERLLQLPPQ